MHSTLSRSIRIAASIWSVSSSLALPSFAQSSPTATVTPQRSPTILSIRAQAVAGAPNPATFFDVVLNHDAVLPTLPASRPHLETVPANGGPSRIVLVLPGVVPTPGLGTRLTTGGLVSAVRVESTTDAARLTLDLSGSADATLTAAPVANVVRVRLQPRDTDGSNRGGGPKSGSAVLHDIEAFQSDLTGLLRLVAQNAGVNVVFAAGGTGGGLGGAEPRKVTIHLRQVPTDQAFDYLTKAGGLAYHKDGNTYVVGSAKELAEAYPAPEPIKPAPATPVAAPVLVQEVFACRYVAAAELAATLKSMFEKEALVVTVGPSSTSPRIDGGSGVGVAGASGGGGGGGGTSGGGGGFAGSGSNGGSGGGGGGSAASGNASLSRTVILAGETSLVARAIELARKLDLRRAQVRIAVRISDVSSEALRDLGIQWGFGGLSFKESAPNAGSVKFGQFARSGLTLDAALAALEKNDRAKLLAAPTLSLLDGEQASILIGDRLQFPILSSSGLGQQNFTVQQVEAGIRLQVAVQMEQNGEMTLTIYPQVSVVSGFLNVNGASYPQISTREQQTTIRAKDGEQIVVGGLIRDEELSNVQAVPFLSKIPLFGELFTYRKKTRKQSEVIVTITPQILKD